MGVVNDLQHVDQQVRATAAIYGDCLHDDSCEAKYRTASLRIEDHGFSPYFCESATGNLITWEDGLASL
jgi:hypothetical protein